MFWRIPIVLPMSLFDMPISSVAQSIMLWSLPSVFCGDDVASLALPSRPCP